MYCIYCGAKYDPYATACLSCGKERAKAPVSARSTPAPTAAATHDPAMRWLLPVGRSGYAIAAGYLGLFGIFIPGLCLLAVVFGWLGLRDIAQHPEKSGKGRAWFGIIAGGLFTLLTLLLVLMR